MFIVVSYLCICICTSRQVLQGGFRAPARSERFWSFLVRLAWPGWVDLACLVSLVSAAICSTRPRLPNRRQKCFQTVPQDYFRAPAGSERVWCFLVRLAWRGWVDVASVVWLVWLAVAIRSTWPVSPTVVKRVSRKLSQRSSESKRKARFPFHVYTGFRFWTLFWLPFGVHFGSILASFWNLSGAILARLGTLWHPLGSFGVSLGYFSQLETRKGSL